LCFVVLVDWRNCSWLIWHCGV